MGDMRIMLVDDNGDLRRGMRDYLARQEGMKVVAECPSGAEALEALGKVRVDVMVLDQGISKNRESVENAAFQGDCLIP